MTALEPVHDDTWRQFREALPRWVALHDTQRAIALVGAAVERQGWTVKNLASECTRDLAGVANPAAVVMFRLAHAADTPPRQPAARVRQPFCGRCDHGWLIDPDTRLPTARCECRKTPA